MVLKDCEQIRSIIALYVEDEQNLLDEQGRYKSYPQLVKEFKGLVSARVIKKILREEHPMVAKAMTTKQKQHHMKY